MQVDVRGTLGHHLPQHVGYADAPAAVLVHGWIVAAPGGWRCEQCLTPRLTGCKRRTALNWTACSTSAMSVTTLARSGKVFVPNRCPRRWRHLNSCCSLRSEERRVGNAASD